MVLVDAADEAIELQAAMLASISVLSGWWNDQPGEQSCRNCLSNGARSVSPPFGSGRSSGSLHMFTISSMPR